MSSTVPSFRDFMEPQNGFERLVKAGRGLPGFLGRSCHRKFRRRLRQRSVAAFEDVVRQLGPGDIAIDLGANVGLITARLAATGAAVHAFEPDRENFAKLTERFQQMGNVHLHQVAAAGHDGEAQLLLPPSYGTRSWNFWDATRIKIVPDSPDSRDFISGDTIQVIDFSKFLQNLPKKAKLVKVDIEGAEWDLLESVEARALDRFEYMFVETHEHLDPSYMPLARAMQERFANLESPYINLFGP